MTTTTSYRPIGGLLALAALATLSLFVSGCSLAGQTEDASDDGLPIVSQNLDEDVPVDIAEIAEESQYVVLASIEAVEPGARFYGHTDEDPREIWTEDVFLRLSIVDSFKGDLANLTSITWPAYFTSAPDSRSRSSRIEIEGVVLSEANPAMTYLFFLTDYGEPWGLTTTYKSAGLMQVNPAGRVTGQVSSIFEEYRGQALEEILQDADLR